MRREVLAVSGNDRSPLFDHIHTETLVFLPGNMLESARIQKNLSPLLVPAGCLLDFDGELVDYLLKNGRAELVSSWPCFHTRLYRWRVENKEFGIVGGTVGAPFAVLVAEELLALGCKALVTISSAGLIDDNFRTPSFLLIDRALRDEGTSHHYLPPGRFSFASLPLVDAVARRLNDAACHLAEAVPGPPTHRFAKQPKLSPQDAQKGSFQLKWRQRLFSLWVSLLRSRLFAWHISPTRWRQDKTTLKRAATQGHNRRSTSAPLRLQQLLNMQEGVIYEST